MSLKNFHIFFIGTALAMLAFTAYASAQESRLLSVVAALSFFTGAAYLRWFLRKNGNQF